MNYLTRPPAETEDIHIISQNGTLMSSSRRKRHALRRRCQPTPTRSIHGKSEEMGGGGLFTTTTVGSEIFSVELSMMATFLPVAGGCPLVISHENIPF